MDIVPEGWLKVHHWMGNCPRHWTHLLKYWTDSSNLLLYWTFYHSNNI